MFLNTGRTIVFQNRDAVQDWCKRPRLGGYPTAELGPTPEPLFLRPRDRGRNGTPPYDKLGIMPDNTWALCAADGGYDTIQILHGLSGRAELVAAVPSCTAPGQQKQLLACPPPDVPLRTGLDATKACSCSDDRAKLATALRGRPWERVVKFGSFKLLNCYGEAAPPTERALRRDYFLVGLNETGRRT